MDNTKGLIKTETNNVGFIVTLIKQELGGDDVDQKLIKKICDAAKNKVKKAAAIIRFIKSTDEFVLAQQIRELEKTYEKPAQNQFVE